jgi:dsDNA-binding SOS-regulon protein
MKKQRSYLKIWLVLTALTTFFCLGTSTSARSQSGQKNQLVQDNDTTRQELARFDQFLDDHPNIAEQVRKDPSLVNNSEYEKNHPELQTYLENHPNIREEIKENPNAFMRQEDRYDRREGDRDDHDTTRGELVRFDQFLDSHREIAEDLRKDPSLVNDAQYEKNHPALQAFLADHPQVREEIKENPNAFMRQEDRYDRREGDRDVHDTTRGELARFDQFLDSHREIAEQLRKDPSLVNNPQFESGHPALHTYLQDHPQIREEIKENPNAFMRQEDRYDRHEGGRNDITRGELARFDQFLDSHREIAEQLRKDPSLVNNGEFTKNHPVLYAYLQDHPEIREEIKENPNSFMRQEGRYDRQENGRGNDMGRDSHEQAARFGQFLNGHSNVADQLSKDPSLVKNQEFMENHPELRDYLKDNPDVQKELMANPPTFVKSAKEFSTDKGRPVQTQTPTQSQSPSSTAEPKPKQ